MGPHSFCSPLQHPLTQLDQAFPWPHCTEASVGMQFPTPSLTEHPVGGRQGVPHTTIPVRPSTSCSRAPIPLGFPGRAPVFLASGQAASPPQLRTGREGGGQGQKPSFCLFVPVNLCQDSAPEPCEPMKYSEGRAFICGLCYSTVQPGTAALRAPSAHHGDTGPMYPPWVLHPLCPPCVPPMPSRAAGLLLVHPCPPGGHSPALRFLVNEAGAQN